MPDCSVTGKRVLCDVVPNAAVAHISSSLRVWLMAGNAGFRCDVTLSRRS